MPLRMLCMQCHALEEPETVLEGSDRIELLAWSVLMVPGFAYCAWRHLGRAKACPRCGSQVLMRESRAAQARRPSLWRDPESEPRFRDAGDFRWPRPLASPRQRLRIGGLGAALVLLASVAWLAALVDPTPARYSLEIASLCWLAVSGWLARQLQRLVRSRDGEVCAAWDGQGRPLHIERI